MLEAGLVGVDITIEEFSLADSWENIYPKLSIQDRIALAIAKQRNIKCLQSPSIWMFYAPIIIIGVIIESLKFAGVI